MEPKKLCTFRLRDHLFGVDIADVQEVLREQRVTPVPLAPQGVCGLINLRGNLVTAVDLATRLGLSGGAVSSPMNVVLRSAGGAVSLLVDEIGEIVDLTADIEPTPETVEPAFANVLHGVYELEDRLVLIVDWRRALGLEPGDLS